MEQIYSGKIITQSLFYFILTSFILCMAHPIFGIALTLLFTFNLLLLLYDILDTAFSKLIISHHGITERKYFPFYREKHYPYTSIEHLYIGSSYRSWWKYRIKTKEGIITVSDYRNWKACFREISQYVNIKLFELELLRVIGIKRPSRNEEHIIR